MGGAAAIPQLFFDALLQLLLLCCAAARTRVFPLLCSPLSTSLSRAGVTRQQFQCARLQPGASPPAHVRMNLTVVGVYILFVALFIFVLLFGQPPNFEGTIVQKGHYFITEGICTFGSSVVVKFCGKRGQRVLDLFGEYYCDRPNPTLQARHRGCKSRAAFARTLHPRKEANPSRSPRPQLFYLSLVTGGYLIFINYSFDRLPGPYLSDIHWCEKGGASPEGAGAPSLERNLLTAPTLSARRSQLHRSIGRAREPRHLPADFPV